MKRGALDRLWPRVATHLEQQRDGWAVPERVRTPPNKTRMEADETRDGEPARFVQGQKREVVLRGGTFIRPLCVMREKNTSGEKGKLISYAGRVSRLKDDFSDFWHIRPLFTSHTTRAMFESSVFSPCARYLVPRRSH